MGYLTSTRAFRSLSAQDPLVDSYRLLVAVELALKDANLGPASGHDVPTMLAAASQAVAVAAPFLATQLNGFSASLANDLQHVTCNDRNGQAVPVPARSYPYLRYCRRAGDWAGAHETPTAAIAALESNCQSLCRFLVMHGAQLGISLWRPLLKLSECWRR